MSRHGQLLASRVRRVVTYVGVILAVLAPSIASAQFFTIGPAGTPGFITDAVYMGPAPPPPLTGPGPPAILLPPPPGNPPAPPGTYIVDALSSGNEAGDRYYYSVAPGAVGLPGTPVSFEVLVGSGPSQFFPGPPVPVGIPPEAHGDIFGFGGGPMFGVVALSPAPAFLLPSPPPGLSMLVDEFFNGLNVASAFGPDNLNALAVRVPPAGFPGAMLYSLAAGGLGAGPFVPGDVVNGATGLLYAPSFALGLDSLGLGSDDLDALIVQDIGPIPGIYEPGLDFLAFSLAPGSLTLPLIAGATPGGGDLLMPVPGGLPAIFIPAVAFGLTPGDNLDAIDVVPEPSTVALAVVGLILLAVYRVGRGRRR